MKATAITNLGGKEVFKVQYILVEQEQVRMVVDNVMPLSEVGTAHQRMERGVMGRKLILVLKA